MASMLSRVSCSSSISHDLKLRRCQARYPVLHAKTEIPTIFKGCTVKPSRLHMQTALRCSPKSSKPYTEANPQPIIEENGSVKPLTNQVESLTPVELKKSAKIHDFCFGIPFGSTILVGGLVSFIFSRNVAALYNGLLSGGLLLALSIISLNVWRQGKSSFPLIFGQAGIAATLMWKYYKDFQLTRSIFPTAFLATISGGMLCFYSYVVISGGNPPPKKSKPSANVG